MAANPVTSLYTVQIGDTLAKIAQRFYGDANRAANIADANGVGINDILPLGRRLKIPTGPEVVAVAADATGEGHVLEEVTVTARAPAPVVWYKDWRIITGAVLAAGLLFYLSKRK